MKNDIAKENQINNMIDKICRVYGFEAKETIRFCLLCKKSHDLKKIEKSYHKLVYILHD